MSLSLDAGESELLSESSFTSGAPNAHTSGAAWPLAMPIFSLAFCSQFQILEISHSLPRASRARHLPRITLIAMGCAFVIYALVGTVCYSMLRDKALRYPNVLTAFGDVPLVACGSLAIAVVNFLKLPLVLLPLRALLLEHFEVKPTPTGAAHAALTFVMVSVLGLLAMLAGNLAFAFQVAGSTAGVSVCFCLPGLLYWKASRVTSAADKLIGQTGAAVALRSGILEEAAGAIMAAMGLVSGLLCLWALFIAS